MQLSQIALFSGHSGIGKFPFLGMTKALILACIGSFLFGCTNIGMHDTAVLKKTNFGPVETLRICVLLDQPAVSEAEGVQLMQAVRTEFAQYGIQVEVPWYQPWQRPSGTGMRTIEDLADRSLPAPCDRLLALAGGNAADVMIGLLGVTEYGSVDTVTHTRGYALCEVTCVNQLFVPTSNAVVHESYHLLGCDHDITMTDCYGRIARLKAAATQNQARGNDFFPTYSLKGQLILQRNEVDLREAMALRVHQSKAP